MLIFLTLWVLIFLPLLYTALVFYFIFFRCVTHMLGTALVRGQWKGPAEANAESSQSVIDVAFGCMMGIPLLFICIPAGLNYYMRCRCT